MVQAEAVDLTHLGFDRFSHHVLKLASCAGDGKYINRVRSPVGRCHDIHLLAAKREVITKVDVVHLANRVGLQLFAVHIIDEDTPGFVRSN
ncbi:hypothetical protein D3C85_1735800 [compost metagenome]